MERVAGVDGELRTVIARLSALAQREDGALRGEGVTQAGNGADAGPSPAVARTALMRLMALARAAGEGS